MKLLFSLVILVPIAAEAVGFTAVRGTNKLGETIVIDEESSAISVWKNGETSEHYSLSIECPAFASQSTFSCSRNGRSPLAGTTYKATTSEKYAPCNVAPYFDNRPGEVYLCVDGCDTPRVPQILYRDVWECG